MSNNDPTKDIAEKYDTKPTLETLLEMMKGMRDEMRAGFAQVESRFDAVDVRLDRMDAVAHETQAKFHALRADFNEFKKELREHFPSAVK
jgi:uncharacterized coiled-coil DUF342 family protein